MTRIDGECLWIVLIMNDLNPIVIGLKDGFELSEVIFYSGNWANERE